MNRFLLHLAILVGASFASPLPSFGSSNAPTSVALAVSPSASPLVPSSAAEVHAAVAITPLEPSVAFSTGAAVTFLNTAGAPVLVEGPTTIAHTTYIAVTPSAQPDETSAPLSTGSPTPSVAATSSPSVVSQASSPIGVTSDVLQSSATPSSLALPKTAVSLAMLSSNAPQSSSSMVPASRVVPTSAAVSVVASPAALSPPAAVPTSAGVFLTPLSGISLGPSMSAVVPTSRESNTLTLLTSAVAFASSDQIVPSSIMHSHGHVNAAPSTRASAAPSSDSVQASTMVQPLPSSARPSTRRFTFVFPTLQGSTLYGSYRSPATSAKLWPAVSLQTSTPVMAAPVTSQAKARTTTLTTTIGITVPATRLVTMPAQATSEAEAAPSPELQTPAFVLPAESTEVYTPVQSPAATSYQAALPKFTLAGTAVQNSVQAAPTPGSAELPAAYTHRPTLLTDGGNNAISAAAGGIQIVPVNPSGVVFVTITETKTQTVDHTVTAFATVTQRVTVAA